MIQLNVCKPEGGEKLIDLCDTEEQMNVMTVGELRKKIIKELRIECNIRIIFATETLEDSTRLSFYGIMHSSTIHAVPLLPGGDGCGQD